MLRIIKKLLSITDKKQRIKLGLIGCMMVVGGFLETCSVSLIFPLVSVMMNPGIMESNAVIRRICERFRIGTVEDLSLLIIGGLIFLFIVKAAFLYLEYYVQNRFACNNRYITQKRLLKTYLARSYEYFLDVTSGEIVYLVNIAVPQSFRLLSLVIGMLTECVISIMLILTIVVIAPLMAALTAVIMVGTMALIYFFIKPILRKAGFAQREYGTLTNKWLIQITSGVKELKVSGREDYFIGQYSYYGGKAIEAERKYLTLSTLPRLLIEACSIGGMLLVVAMLVVNGQEIERLVPQISAFAMAAVKLLPAANRISTAFNDMVYQEPSLDKLMEHLKTMGSLNSEITEDTRDTEDLKDKNRILQRGGLTVKDSIRMRDITYHYPNSTAAVLKHADMEIPVGKSVGIVGSSGAGKTTVVDILLGLLVPKEGQILSDDENVMEQYGSWLSCISYIPQMIFMLDDTIRANVAFGFPRQSVDDSQVWHVLKEAQLEDFVSSLPEGLDTEIGERGVRLSGGQRQRIGIARALYTDPELLIFDEATSALDNETEAAIMNSINSLHGKKTMVIIAHRLGTIEDCDIVYRVENGQITVERKGRDGCDSQKNL